MKSLKEYKKLNYKAVVQYDPKTRSYFVEFPDLPGCMTDAETASEAIEKALKIKDEWLEIAFDAGYSIPEPAERIETTGRQTVRMPKSLHARVIKRAEDEGVSQNQLILSFISEGLARTRDQGSMTKELAEIRDLRDSLKNLLTDASSVFGSPLSSMPLSNESAYRLLPESSINAYPTKDWLFANAPFGKTYAAADMITVCGENVLEERPKRASIIAATEEGYQGGYA